MGLIFQQLKATVKGPVWGTWQAPSPEGSKNRNARCRGKLEQPEAHSRRWGGTSVLGRRQRQIRKWDKFSTVHTPQETGHTIPEWEKSSDEKRQEKNANVKYNNKPGKPNLQKGSRHSPKCKQSKKSDSWEVKAQQQQLQGFSWIICTNKHLGVSRVCTLEHLLVLEHEFLALKKKYICLKTNIGNNLFFLNI